MEQEQQFLKALEAVTTVRVEGDRLEFRDNAGALQVTAKREGDAQSR
jgi:heat shock protein HslJ